MTGGTLLRLDVPEAVAPDRGPRGELCEVEVMVDEPRQVVALEARIVQRRQYLMLGLEHHCPHDSARRAVEEPVDQPRRDVGMRGVDADLEPVGALGPRPAHCLLPRACDVDWSEVEVLPVVDAPRQLTRVVA